MMNLVIIVGKEKFLGALVDEQDLEKYSKFPWLKDSRGYIYTRIENKKVYLHRMVMDVLSENTLIDHKNRNPRDNRKENLRKASYGQNGANYHKTTTKFSSNYKGVSRCKNRWKSYVKIRGRLSLIGSFKTEVEAAKAYNERAKLAFGEFACLNVLPE